ncbi:MAG: hypothetical protein JWM33_1391 [Caulobacteraceae bacterium]|nr:hypothetical protein [Caulobacteraceae bacterium]
MADNNDPLGTFERHGDNLDLRFERLYPRSIETVWAALTNPARLEDWLSPAVVEPQLGGRYELFVNRDKGRMIGTILTWEPPTLLEYRWDTGDAPPNIVRCELSAEGPNATRLVFIHKDVPFKWAALTLPGWHQLLENLGRLLAGQEQPAPGMARWRELQQAYLEAYGLEGSLTDPPAGHEG